MQDTGWIVHIGNKGNTDISALGYNLHLYLVWSLLQKSIISGKENEWIEWMPYVFGDKFKYLEVVGTLENLLLLGVIRGAKIDYITRDGKEDEQQIYRSIVLNADILEDEENEFDYADFHFSFTNPKLDFLKFHIQMSKDYAERFIGICLINWEKGELKHYQYDLYEPRKQKEFLIGVLQEKFEYYGHKPFDLDLRELPKEVDGFCTLLAFEKAGIVRLSDKRKLVEPSDKIPSFFNVEILKIRDDSELPDTEALLREIENALIKGIKDISIREKGGNYLFEAHQEADKNHRSVDLQKTSLFNNVTAKTYGGKLVGYNITHKKKFKKTKKDI